MSDTRYATVHYRRLVRDDAGLVDGETLSDAICNALDKQHPDGGRYRDNWLHRLMPSLEDDVQRKVVNNVHTDAQTAFGDLCTFTPGDLQALIDATATSGTSTDIAETRAPSGNEYLKGIAYWLVVGDHCYVVQDVAVRTRALEEYLTWFLRDTRIIGGAKTVTFQAELDVAAIGGDLDDVHLKGVQSIEIGGVMPGDTPDRESSGRLGLTRQQRFIEERKVVREGKAQFSAARKFLEDMLGSVEVARIVDEKPREAKLDIRVNIGYRAIRRRVDTSFMDDLAKGLRNMDDGEVRIRTKSGIIQGNDARLQTRMPFKPIRANGVLLDLDDVRTQLRKVHDRFLEDGKIS